MNHTLVQITSNKEDAVQFAVLRSELNCTKYSVCPRKHYLGFYVPDITGLSSNTHGLIGMNHYQNMLLYNTYITYFTVGQFLKQSTQVIDAQMKVGGKLLAVKPFERLNGLLGHYQKCWSTDNYGLKFLDGITNDYLVKDLFDSDFAYSHYHCN